MTTALKVTKKPIAIELARFRVEIHCPQCATTLEQALSTTDGVRRARVHPLSGDTILEYDAELVAHRDLQEAIEAAGLDVEFLRKARGQEHSRSEGAHDEGGPR